MRALVRSFGLLAILALVGLSAACSNQQVADAPKPPIREVQDTIKVFSKRVNQFEDRLSRGLCAVTRVVFDSLPGKIQETTGYGDDQGSWRFCRPDSESPEYPPPPPPIPDPW